MQIGEPTGPSAASCRQIALRVRLLDELGLPLSRWLVECQVEAGDDLFSVVAFSDTAGWVTVRAEPGARILGVLVGQCHEGATGEAVTTASGTHLAAL